MPPAKLLPSAGSVIAIGRQTAAGTARSTNLYKILGMTVSPKFESQMSNLGIEVGASSIVERRNQKEVFMPEIDFSGHLRVGALMNLMCAMGYQPLAVGTATGTPLATTLSAAVTSRHAKVVTVNSATGYVVGDWVQIGTISGPPPVSTDTSEVHIVAALPSTNAVQSLAIASTATGGTFTLTYGANTTAGIAYNAAAATIQTALQGLASVGAGNLLVTGSVGGPFTITAAGTFAATNIPLVVADGTLLTGATNFGTRPYATVTETTPGTAANQLAFKNRLLYTYASGTAVARMDQNKGVTHYLLHLDPASPLDADLFSIYYKSSNSDLSIEALFVDCLGIAFSPSLQTGSIATVQAAAKALSVTRVPDLMQAAFATLINDPSDVTINNTRGSGTILGNTIDMPRQLSVNMSSEVYDDAVLTQYSKQSAIHLTHSISASTSGKFIKSFFDQIIFNTTTANIVSDVIPESSFTFTAQSATPTVPGGTVYNSFAITAPDCQLAGYNPQVNTSQPVEGNIEMLKIVQQLATNSERWYFTLVNNCTTDVYSAA